MYNLYYRKIPDTVWTKITLNLRNVIISSAGSQTRRYVLRDLINQSKYEIKIEPVNSVGVGPESAIITARTLMKPGIPSNVIMTTKYGLLPLIITDTSRNYINITWNKPDSGGSAIKYYNITITPPASMGSVITYPYNVVSTNTLTSYCAYIGFISNSYLVDGSYSVVIGAYNGYEQSNESSRAFVTVNPTSAKAFIFNIDGYYSQSGLEYALMTFSINSQWQPANPISYVRINGLNNPYLAYLNSDKQPISGTGEHKIIIPSFFGGTEIIIVGTEYSITITLVYSDGQQQTSELFQYTPEIKYLTT